jgi:hypothetical protein
MTQAQQLAQPVRVTHAGHDAPATDRAPITIPTLPQHVLAALPRTASHLTIREN